MTAEEKRSHERAVVRHKVTVQPSGGGDFEGFVENLGALGALVTTTELEAPLEIGQRVTLRFDGEGGRRSIAGRILRLEQEFAGGEIRRAFAVRFDENFAW